MDTDSDSAASSTRCEAQLKTLKLTVVYRDTGALVRRQDVAAVTATQEAAHCVHTLVVAHAAAGVLTLIHVCMSVCERVCVCMSEGDKWRKECRWLETKYFSLSLFFVLTLQLR